MSEIEKLGGKAIPVRCDVTQQRDVIKVLEQVNSCYGAVDIMINNAGITTPEPFLGLPVKKWDLVLAVNLRGTFLCSKAVLPQMVERRRGSIINVSSVLAKTIEFSIPYGVSKAAIERFTLGLAKELKEYNISVNALCPDFTLTEAVKSQRPNIDTAGWQLPENVG